MAITISDIGKCMSGNNGPTKPSSKFFWINPNTSELSPMHDSREAAVEAASRVLKTLDKTDETILICEVVMGLQATRTIATESFMTPTKKK